MNERKAKEGKGRKDLCVARTTGGVGRKMKEGEGRKEGAERRRKEGSLCCKNDGRCREKGRKVKELMKKGKTV